MSKFEIINEARRQVLPGDEQIFDQNIPWYEAITRVCFMFKPLFIVEFGVRAGYSSLVATLTIPCQVIGYDSGIDPNSELYLEHAQKIVPTIELYKISTKDLYSIPTCDLVLVDADHSYEGCKHELELAKSVSKYILVDDYNSNDVKVAVLESIKDLTNPRTVVMANGRVILLENNPIYK